MASALAVVMIASAFAVVVMSASALSFVLALADRHCSEGIYVVYLALSTLRCGLKEYLVRSAAAAKLSADTCYVLVAELYKS